MVTPDCLTETIKRAFNRAKEQEQQIVDLQKVSGHTVEELTRLFAAGYTLSPPKPSKSLSQLYWEDRNKW